MNGSLVTNLVPRQLAWRELASWIFLPADVIWLLGWFCLLTGSQQVRDAGFAFAVFVFCSALAYGLIRVINARKSTLALRLLPAAFGFLVIAWLGVSLLIYGHPEFDLHKLTSDIWNSFSGLRSLSLEFWSLSTISLIWLRAVFYARSPVTQDSITRRIQFDLVAMLILLAISNGMLLTIQLTGMLLFLLLSLFSLSLARIADINLYRGGRQLPFQWTWLAALGGISTLTVILAGSLAFLTGRWLSALVILVTNGILAVLRFLLEIIFKPLAMLLLSAMQFLGALIPAQEPKARIPELNLEPPGFLGDLDQLELERTSAEAFQTAQPYILVVLLVLIAAGVVLFILMRSWRERSSSLDLSDAEQQGELNYWQRLRKTIARKLQSALGLAALRINPKRAAGLVRAARIRWIYHQLELSAERLGSPRPVAVTPREYKPVLEEVFPGHSTDLELITSAYQAVRYGELPESEQEVIAVRDAWERLKASRPLKSRLGMHGRTP